MHLLSLTLGQSGFNVVVWVASASASSYLFSADCSHHNTHRGEKGAQAGQ